MICPYMRLSETFAQETNYEYDAEGHVIKETRAYNAIAIPLKCREHECGAWKNEQCWFYADTIEIVEGDTDDGNTGAAQV